MDSDEILKKAITPVGAKSIAMDMNLSTSLIYKWCQSKDYNTGAADNPLDRIVLLYELTEARTLQFRFCPVNRLHDQPHAGGSSRPSCWPPAP